MNPPIAPTPLWREDDNLLLKCEFRNPTGSHKARAARHIVEAAIAAGELVPHGPRRILEKTGGNLGLGLAYAAAGYGIGVDVVVGLAYSPVRREMVRRFGARTVGIPDLQEGRQPKEIIDQLLADDPDGYYFTDQFNNPANVTAHETETGAELVEQLSGLARRERVILVKGIGTGASLTGIARRLKRDVDDVTVVAVEPDGYSLEREVFPTHPIEGIAVGQVPPLLDRTLIDSFETVTIDDVRAAQDWLARRRGMLPGLSSGATLSVARDIATQQPDAWVVSVIYDSGEVYVS